MKPNEFQAQRARGYLELVEKQLLIVRETLKYAATFHHLTHGEKNGLISFADWKLIDAMTDLKNVQSTIKVLGDLEIEDELPF